jgi:proteasome lid subunit RPN8/RPN11
MAARAEADYPEETCGLLFGHGLDLEVVPMENIQDRMHRDFPNQFPRDARRAYYFDPKELERIRGERERNGIPLRAIYHSHPEEDSYFSETDSEAAAPFGEPNPPGAVYLVFSVRKGKVVDLKAFDWSASAGRYTEVPIEAV